MEQSKLWQSEDYSGIELLSATYTNFEFKKHWHNELAIGVIEAGAESVWYRGENLLIPEQQIIAINPGEVHTGLAGVESGWRYRMFYFDLSYLATHLSDSGLSINSVIDTPVINDATLYQDLLQLHQALELSSLRLSKDTLLTHALENLFARYGSSIAPDKAAAIDIKSATLAKAYISDNWQGNPSLEDLETYTQCNRFQLLRSFKALYWVTPHQYLLLIKTQKAKSMLSQGMSYIDTALACGFYDQSHFNRNFRRVYGVAPSRYFGYSEST